MFDLWFKNHPANIKFKNDAQDTFHDGGYYKAELNESVTVLAMNTLYYNIE